MASNAGPPAVPSLDIARVVATSATAHIDVVDLDAGLVGEFATYGIGGRVAGVRVDIDRAGHAHIQVRIAIRFGRPIPDIGAEVRARVLADLSALGVDGSVHVHVADITDDAEPTARALPSGTP